MWPLLANDLGTENQSSRHAKQGHRERLGKYMVTKGQHIVWFDSCRLSGAHTPTHLTAELPKRPQKDNTHTFWQSLQAADGVKC